MIREIADGVFAQEGRYFQEQRTLVRGSRWCVLIDAPQYFDEAEELSAFAKDLTSDGVKVAIITHGHLDHTATLQVFHDALIAGTAASRQYMQQKGQDELERLSRDDDELKSVHLVLPSITFSSETAVYDDTGRCFRCIPSPGHSDDSLVVFLEDDKILFSGDSLSPIVPPYFPDSTSIKLEETLVKIRSLNADIIVPGHGRVISGLEVVREVSSAIKYLENLRTETLQRIIYGVSPDDAQNQIAWSDCSDKDAPPEEYLKYHRENIAKMAAEVCVG